MKSYLSRIRNNEFVIWFIGFSCIMAIVFLFAAIAAYTPLGHLIDAIIEE